MVARWLWRVWPLVSAIILVLGIIAACTHLHFVNQVPSTDEETSGEAALTVPDLHEPFAIQLFNDFRVWLNRHPNGVSRKSYGSIRLGMRAYEVEMVLGGKANGPLHPGGPRWLPVSSIVLHPSHVWSGPQGEILIGLQNGRVRWKSFAGPY
jgi:hypothetical protein